MTSLVFTTLRVKNDMLVTLEATEDIINKIVKFVSHLSFTYPISKESSESNLIQLNHRKRESQND